MDTNINKYKKDFEKLVTLGIDLLNAMQYECFPEKIEKQAKKTLKEKSSDFIKKLPDFYSSYQNWYSESKVLIKQLLPDRLNDFVRYYEKTKTRKSISY